MQLWSEVSEGRHPARALLLGAVEEILVVGRAQVAGVAVTEEEEEEEEEKEFDDFS